MKTCTFIFWISFLILFPQGLYSKSLTNREQYSIDSDNSNGISEVDAGNEAAIHDTFRPRHKYKDGGHLMRYHRSNSDKIKDEAKALQCAVMYKDNEPVGILQPYKESYRFLPVSGDPTLVDIDPVPVKRKTLMDVIYPKKVSNEDYNDETPENSNQFTDDRYPSIFAKFKIDSRLDKTLNPELSLKRSMYKRDTDKPDISDEQVSSLKTTLSKMKNDNSAVVEEELKNILDDMGLIDDYDDKQEAKRDVAEDENLEEGTNKINLIKEEHNETRNKRGDDNETTTTTTTTTTPPSNDSTTEILPTKAQIEEEHTVELESIDLLKDGEAKLKDSDKADPEVSTDHEELRKKREFEENLVKTESTKEDKRAATDTVPDIKSAKLVKEAELNQYEKRVEREIRDKIQKLKEEVKEEIMSLKNTSPTVPNEESDTKRRKRQVVNTLIDEETQDIDPNLSADQPLEPHHIRRKRGLFDAATSVIPGNEINKNKVELQDGNKEIKQSRSVGNTNDSMKIINPKSDISSNDKQKIDEDKNGFRFVIDYEVNKGIKSKEKKVISVDKKDNKQMNEKKIDDKFVNFRTDIIENRKQVGNSTQKLRSSNFKPLVNKTKKGRNIYDLTKLGAKTKRKNCCKETSCSMCPEKKERTTKNAIRMKTRRDNANKRMSLSNNTNILRTKKMSVVDKKKDIINNLNVIGRKQYNINDAKGYKDKCKENCWCPKCEKISDVNEKLTEMSTNNVEKVASTEAYKVNKYYVNYKPKSTKTIPPPKAPSVSNHALAIREGIANKTVPSLPQSHSNSTFTADDVKIANKSGTIEKTKRFIGINPILQNATNSTSSYLSRKLKQADEDGDKETLNMYDDKVVEDIDNIANVKRTRENSEENLEKFNDDTAETNVDTGIRLRLKRFGAKERRDRYDKLHARRKRQSKDDLEENVYQYNDSEFNEDADVDNQSYYDEPYANNNLASANSNCNCDKSNGACKCGSQKSSLSVPNVREAYSDYEDSPASSIEKKSVSHCNCDKNGKHCKCKTFKDDSQYTDYVDDQPSNAEKQPVDLYEADAGGDMGMGDERAPRLPRQKSRRAEGPMEVSDARNGAEDYESYDKGARLAKRETRFKKLAGNQPFQNGEYFVDLHPNIYRLTPVDTSREKRENFKNLVAIHGGGPVMNHLVAIRQRSMLPHSRFRRRVQSDDNREQRQLIDMSDEDIFGALPQGFAGELARYKRVKRAKLKK